jgi:hypothetical protein
MFGFKTASQFLERYHSVVNCALNMEDLISKILVNLVNNKDIATNF